MKIPYMFDKWLNNGGKVDFSRIQEIQRLTASITISWLFRFMWNDNIRLISNGRCNWVQLAVRERYGVKQSQQYKDFT